MDAVDSGKGSNKPLDQHFDVQSAQKLSTKKSDQVFVTKVEVEHCLYSKTSEIKS